MLQSYLFCVTFSDEVARQIEAHHVVLSAVAEKKKAPSTSQSRKPRKNPPKVVAYHKKIKNENFTCKYCLRKFGTTDQVSKHISENKECYDKNIEMKRIQPGSKGCKELQDIIDNYTLKCKYCHLGMKNLKQRENHVFNHHRGDKNP